MFGVVVLLHAHQFLCYQRCAVYGGQLGLEFFLEPCVCLYAFYGIVECHGLFLVEEEEVRELLVNGSPRGQSDMMMVGEYHIASLIEGVDISVDGSAVHSQLFCHLAC